MVEKEAPNWNTIRVRESTYTEIKKALTYDKVKKEGISSITQFATNAITKQLKELEQKRFAHQNTSEDKVRILDNHIGAMGDIVTIFLKEEIKQGFCDHCESENCVHVKYMWGLKDVAATLKERDFKSPYPEFFK